MVKPGVTPSDLRERIVHAPGAGPLPVSAPRARSAEDMGWRPIRLVNQLESGTSPTVLMFSARFAARSPAPRKEFSIRSNWPLTSTSRTFDASCVSGSRHNGSSGKNCGAAARPGSPPHQRPDARTSAAAHGRMRWSERIAEFEVIADAFAGAGGDVDAEEHRAGRIEAEADAVRPLQIAEIEIRDARRDGAEIREERHV